MKKFSPAVIGLLQALGLVGYISLIALFFGNANQIFGPVDEFWAPILFLSLFVVSALICGLIIFGYPFLVLWEQKNTKKAVFIVLFTAAYLILGISSFLIYQIYLSPR